MGQESDEDVEEEQPVPAFEDAGASFEMMRWCLTSFPIDDASMKQLIQLERELLFIHRTCHTKLSTLLNYLKKYSIWVCMPQLFFIFYSRKTL